MGWVGIPCPKSLSGFGMSCPRSLLGLGTTYIFHARHSHPAQKLILPLQRYTLWKIYSLEGILS